MMLTRASLHAWATAAGQSPNERANRATVELMIIARSRTRVSTGPSRTALPDGLNVDGDLELYGLSYLTTLPDGLRVGGDLGLRGATSLTALPAGLSVGGDLELRECTSLTALPNGLRVRGDLELWG